MSPLNPLVSVLSVGSNTYVEPTYTVVLYSACLLSLNVIDLTETILEMAANFVHQFLIGTPRHIFTHTLNALQVE